MLHSPVQPPIQAPQNFARPNRSVLPRDLQGRKRKIQIRNSRTRDKRNALENNVHPSPASTKRSGADSTCVLRSGVSVKSVRSRTDCLARHGCQSPTMRSGGALYTYAAYARVIPNKENQRRRVRGICAAGVV